MESITVGTCFRGAWKDAGLALLEKPAFTLAIFALFLVSTNIQLGARASGSALTSADPSHVAHARDALMLALASLLRLGAMICLTIHVMRFSVFGGDPSSSHWFSDGSFWRYLRLNAKLGLVIAIMIAIAVVCVAGSAVLMRHEGITLGRPLIKLASAAIFGIATLLTVFVTIRLSLLFCHTAIGGRSTMKASWIDTRGRVWAIVGTHFLTASPLLIIAIIFVIARGQFVTPEAGSDVPIFSAALMQTTWLLIGISSGAACSAWLYQRYAATILDT